MQNETSTIQNTIENNLTKQDNPKFKLLENGAASLTDNELISIIMNCQLKTVQEFMILLNNDIHELGKIDKHDIKIPGIGMSRITSLIAALEFGRRRSTRFVKEKQCIKSSKNIADYLRIALMDLHHEIFGVIFLNRANKIIKNEIVSQGGIAGTVADPRLILRKAIMHRCSSMILYHNHPSGNTKPSKADEEITLKIKQAASYIDVKILDHLIVSDEGYYSFADEGIL